MSALFGPRLCSGGTLFRLWAPGISDIGCEVDGLAPAPMKAEADGWHEVKLPCGAGSLYRFRLPDGELVPDPASRFQPDDVHGPSQVVDPESYVWTMPDWKGRPWHETVIYEAHAGLLGGYDGVADALPRLVELGITAIELMPIGDFSGSRNWGYDGVLPFAPDSAYGTPDALKAMIDLAHSLGLMVFLDVVYNHFGPDGNWLSVYAPEFFQPELPTPWGAAIAYSRPEVRRFFIENALYWLGEFRFDGLRLDAVHAIPDQAWIPEMASEVRAAFPGRHVHLVLENERNDAGHLDGQVDAQWNDDFHNVIHVLLTDETHAYYRAFADSPGERLARALAEGFVYQGEPFSVHEDRPRGSPSGHLPPTAFVNFLQNHDQVGNRALGERLTVLTDPDRLRAATVLLLLCPAIPLIFMGDDIGARQPFLFFTDFHDSLADAVREGRRKEFAGFPAFADPEARAHIPDPNAPHTFAASRLDEPPEDAKAWSALYRQLLRLRHDRIIPHLCGARSRGARAIGSHAVIAVWQLANGELLTIACNLGDTAASGDFPSAVPVWGNPPDGLLPARTTVAWIDAT